MTQKLEFADVSFDSNAKSLFGPTNLSINPSRITVVLGPNGSGKSLFLSLCHGLLTPTSGTVRWNDKPTKAAIADRGFIFQRPVIMRRSVADNVHFALAKSALSKQEKSNRVSELLRLVGLSDKASQPAALLSGGESQSMALARALAAGPETLLMDEPTSNLDPNTTAMFEEIIAQLAATGMSIFWSTHDLAQARRIASYVIVISDGQIEEHGVATDVFRSPRSDAAKRFFEGHAF